MGPSDRRAKDDPMDLGASRVAVSIVAIILLSASGCAVPPPPSPSQAQAVDVVMAKALSDRQALYTVVTGTGHLIPITTPTFADGVPVWSPDGSRLAFVRFAQDGSSSIHVVAPDGSADRAITSEPGVSDILPTWSSDSTQIAFVRVRGNGGQATDSAVLTVTIDGTATKHLTHDPSAAPNDAVWSPDGTLIAFTAGSRDRSIWVTDAAGQGTRQITPPLGRLTLDWPLVWSPDSAEIAFAAAGQGSQDDVYLVGKTGKIMDLTDDRANEGAPAWSPDGAQLAFWSDRDGPGDIYVVTRRTGTVRRLTTDSGISGVVTLAWSTDGMELIVWESPAGLSEARNYLLLATGGTPRLLTSDPGAEYMALWRP